MENDKFPKRKNIRLKEYDYASNGGYFITICSENKKKIFWDKNYKTVKQSDRVGADNIRPEDIELSEEGKIVKQAIENIPKHYENLIVDNYVIMPNHIHIIIFIDKPSNGRIISAPTRSVVIGQMKRYASKMAGKPIWQKSFYDHILRNYNDYLEKRNYILTNPEKWVEDEYYFD